MLRTFLKVSASRVLGKTGLLDIRGRLIVVSAFM
jgi:hypothetical protein